MVGGAAFTLTINGTNFVAASTVTFGGSAPATTFVNSTQSTAVIPASAIASAGTLAATVTNPAPAGGTSNAMNFSVTSGLNPARTGLRPLVTEKFIALEVPPAGAGLVTVTAGVPVEAMLEAGMAAVNCVELTNVVVGTAPPKLTVEDATKFVPLICKRESRPTSHDTVRRNCGDRWSG